MTLTCGIISSMMVVHAQKNLVIVHEASFIKQYNYTPIQSAYISIV